MVHNDIWVTRKALHVVYGCVFQEMGVTSGRSSWFSTISGGAEAGQDPRSRGLFSCLKQFHKIYSCVKTDINTEISVASTEKTAEN